MGQPGPDRFGVGVNGNEGFDSHAQVIEPVFHAVRAIGFIDQPGPDRARCKCTACDTGAACKTFKLDQFGARQVDGEGQSRHHRAPGKIARRIGADAIPLCGTAREPCWHDRRGKLRACRTVGFWIPQMRRQLAKAAFIKHRLLFNILGAPLSNG